MRVEFRQEGSRRALFDSLNAILPASLEEPVKDRLRRVVAAIAVDLHKKGGYIGCKEGTPLHTRSYAWASQPDPLAPRAPGAAQKVEQPPFAGAPLSYGEPPRPQVPDLIHSPPPRPQAQPLQPSGPQVQPLPPSGPPSPQVQSSPPEQPSPQVQVTGMDMLRRFGPPPEQPSPQVQVSQSNPGITVLQNGDLE